NAAAKVLLDKVAGPAAALKTAWDADKSLTNTRALAYKVLGADANTNQNALVEALVNACWTNVLGKQQEDKISEDELKRLWSFLSFWRNVPGEVLETTWSISEFEKIKGASLTKTGEIYVMDAGNYTRLFEALEVTEKEAAAATTGAPFGPVTGLPIESV
ncbi:MAG: hypothetical protein AABZ57_06210, partial [Candidatus Margulisiibacteriota bacterium]